MAVYTVALGKGGAGKTTTSAELAYHLTVRQGRRVLAVDLDQQRNLSTRLGVTPDTELAVAGDRVLVAADVVMGECGPADAAIEAPSLPGVHVLVGSHDLTQVEASPPPDLVTSLRDVLPTVVNRYDDVVIDTPPSLGGLTLAGLAAADVVVVPVAMEGEAFDQVGRLEQVITHTLARRVRPGLRIGWIVPTRYDGRQRLPREMVELLTEQYPDRVTTPVREATVVRDAYLAGQTVSSYRPHSNPAADYAAACDAITGKDPR